MKRVDKAKDNQLLLVSRWDTLFSDDEVQAGLAEDYDARLSGHVFGEQGHYKAAWNAFANRASPTSGSLATMPYAACRVKANQRVRTARLAGFVNHFNRTLANWLYENATQSLGGTRRTLFPDVVLSRRRLGGLYDRFVYFSVSGWR